VTGGKNLHESFYEFQDKLRCLKKTAETLLAEIEDIKDGLWKLTAKAASYELAREALENPPVQKEAATFGLTPTEHEAEYEETEWKPVPEENPPEDPPRRKSAFEGKYWDEKKGEWVEEKPVKDADADGNFELDIF